MRIKSRQGRWLSQSRIVERTAPELHRRKLCRLLFQWVVQPSSPIQPLLLAAYLLAPEIRLLIQVSNPFPSSESTRSWPLSSDSNGPERWDCQSKSTLKNHGWLQVCKPHGPWICPPLFLWQGSPGKDRINCLKLITLREVRIDWRLRRCCYVNCSSNAILSSSPNRQTMYNNDKDSTTFHWLLFTC